MRYLQTILAVAFMLSSVQSFAHGACSAYEATCKSDATVTAATTKKAKWEAMHSCVSNAAAADATNGPACTAEMAKHHHDHMGAAPAPATPPAGN